MMTETRKQAVCTAQTPLASRAIFAAGELGDGPSSSLLWGDIPADAERERYASSVSLAQMLYGGDLAEWLPRAHPGVALERQQSGPVVFPDPSAAAARSVTVVRAPMGSGKTTALIRWLREAVRSPEASVLVVSCRRSFTQTLAARFASSGLADFVTYLTSAHYIMNDRPFHRLIVQVESLHRVGPNLLNDYDVLVLDEVMSTIGQLYSPTMRYLHQVDGLLVRLLSACPRVIAMDATANAQLVDFLCGIRGENNIHVVLGEYALPGFSERRCTLLSRLGHDVLREALRPTDDEAPETASQEALSLSSREDEESFFGALAARLASGLNVCLFSTTVSFSEIASRFCRRFTDRVLLLNSLTPLCDVSEWDRYRVVVYTTVVTVGLSFDAGHFHSMFAYVKPMAYGPDMVSVYQSLGRVRALRQNELLVYADGSGTRADPVFTPMLLNHVVNAEGRWPAQFRQVTNALCRGFRRRCGSAARSHSAARAPRLHARFQYKHYFERCTLACLSDSLNILHTLLDLNRVRVRFYGCDVPLTAEDFCRFMRRARADALVARRELRGLRQGAVAVPPEAWVADSEEVGVFVEKYLRPQTPPAAVVDVMRAIREPTARMRFVNVALLEACVRVPTAVQSSAVFYRLYDHYATGVVPTVDTQGGLEMIALSPVPNVGAVWELFGVLAHLAVAVGWDVGSGGSRGDFSEADITRLMRPVRHRCAQLVFELNHCNVSDPALLAETPVCRVAAALSGRSPRPAVREAEHSASLFRLMWEEMFGAQMPRSTQTFPGVDRVKNLTKRAISDLLDTHNISRDDCRTYRQLYARLMQHKKDFAGVRYKLRAPRWARHLRTRATEGSVDAVLEAALSELPTEAWPTAQGAVNFGSL
ncbi:DNA replication origin-binding helicase [Saimiriine alphaherpesvirus 1]|uniref:Replication origin-binding protein n=3 Tax=Saimiriine herpesvirus 1 (strain MV-5-4-PSL) TaxID=10353 RepID=E2IUG1_SHV1|nr:DNA replication origin-binding helicase [Saimiriine alphaherpesvirus 1]ADO13819.1 DNA replication origin-binding helicase [Saimiriine alphaherpesvirus 1]